MNNLAFVSRTREKVRVVAPGDASAPAIQVNRTKLGAVLAILLGGGHFVWAALVATGWAQAIMRFIFWMHFLTPPWTVGSFHIGTAAILVLLTATVGFVIGYIVASLWNWAQR